MSLSLAPLWVPLCGAIPVCMCMYVCADAEKVALLPALLASSVSQPICMLFIHLQPVH